MWKISSWRHFVVLKKIKMWRYCQTPHMRARSVGNRIVDHSDVVGAWPVSAAATTSSFSTSDLVGFSGLGKDNCKTWWETFKFGDSVWLILEVWWYINYVFCNVRVSQWFLINKSLQKMFSFFEVYFSQEIFKADNYSFSVTCYQAYPCIIGQNYQILYIDGLVQNCSNSTANALELLQSCTKPSI